MRTYTIGSTLGKELVHDMNVGESLTANDNSVWTKGPDNEIYVQKGGEIRRGVVTGEMPSGAYYKSDEEKMRDAYRSQISGLQASRDSQMAYIDAQRNKVKQQYGDAMRQTQAQSDRQQQSYNEYFNDRGLNSGASGQAYLANQNELAGNLNALNVAKTDAMQSLDAQAAAIQKQYKDAARDAYYAYKDNVSDYEYNKTEDLQGGRTQYNYHITTQLGKQVAEQLPVGNKFYSTADNSVWEKADNGTLVINKDGKTLFGQVV